uniref:Discoidin, CUB and LCCL domain-containing protein 2-like n=1 Tax=Sinocyclocheilus anshuiensis TaxID=1608454 RepID=A0A671PGL5_9TELE
MDVSLMVGRGTGGAAVSILILFILLLGARSSRAQKGDGCGHTVLDVGSGSLASLGYPLSYPTNCVCEWEISVTTGHTILVRIADLDIDTNNCQVSYLRLYNGHGPGRTEIVKFCGGREWRDAVIHSEGHQVTVQFMSGPHYLITCLEKGKHFSEAEFSKFCPAGCLTDFGEVSGTIPHGYRDSSPLCLAGIHAGCGQQQRHPTLRKLTGQQCDICAVSNPFAFLLAFFMGKSITFDYRACKAV